MGKFTTFLRTLLIKFSCSTAIEDDESIHWELANKNNLSNLNLFDELNQLEKGGKDRKDKSNRFEQCGDVEISERTAFDLPFTDISLHANAESEDLKFVDIWESPKFTQFYEDLGLVLTEEDDQQDEKFDDFDEYIPLMRKPSVCFFNQLSDRESVNDFKIEIKCLNQGDIENIIEFSSSPKLEESLSDKLGRHGLVVKQIPALNSYDPKQTQKILKDSNTSSILEQSMGLSSSNEYIAEVEPKFESNLIAVQQLANGFSLEDFIKADNEQFDETVTEEDLSLRNNKSIDTSRASATDEEDQSIYVLKPYNNQENNWMKTDKGFNGYMSDISEEDDTFEEIKTEISDPELTDPLMLLQELPFHVMQQYNKFDGNLVYECF